MNHRPGPLLGVTREQSTSASRGNVSSARDPDLKSAGEDYSVGIRRYDRVGVSSARSSSGVEIK